MTGLRRALVVDDSMTICRVVEKLLRNCGFEQIEVAQDGAAALGCMKVSNFDIIICDWEMVPMSGTEILKEIRQNPRTRHTPFILMSAKKEPHWILTAKKAGADCLIAKPFDADLLKMKLAQIGRRS